MKTKVLALFIIIFCLLSLSSCSQGEPASCREVLDAVIRGEVGLPAGNIYDMRAAEGEVEFLSDSLINALYGGGSMPRLRQDWLDCALFLSLGESPCELAVFYCASGSAACDTARLLCTRLDAIRTVKGDLYPQMIERASVTVRGNFVLFFISSDPDAANKRALAAIS